MLKLPVFFPAGTVTVSGTEAAELKLSRSTVSPPGGAIVVKFTLALIGPQAGTLLAKLSELSHFGVAT